MRAVEDAVRTRNELGPAPEGQPAPGRLPRRGSGRPGSWSSRSSCPSTSTPESGSTSGQKGRVVIDFATLEDLERIYRAMTEGPRHAAMRGGRERRSRALKAPPYRLRLAVV